MKILCVDPVYDVVILCDVMTLMLLAGRRGAVSSDEGSAQRRRWQGARQEAHESDRGERQPGAGAAGHETGRRQTRQHR